MQQLSKYLVLFAVGGSIYYSLELLFRHYSHWTMFVLGGICFVLCGLVNKIIDHDMPLWKQMWICALIITSLEMLFGVVLNLILNLNIWDYSQMPFNLWGQICMPFMGLWYLLSLPAILLDDYIRYWFYGEEKPSYKLE